MREARWSVEVMVMAAMGGGQTFTAVKPAASAASANEVGEQEPIAGLEAAQALEKAAHAMTGHLIRIARQAGRTWQQIGEALDLDTETASYNGSLALAAYNFALGYQAGPGTKTFDWTCLACEQLVTDRGPAAFPVGEQGHSDGCYRRGPKIAE
jgi:hypothetical protein